MFAFCVASTNPPTCCAARWCRVTAGRGDDGEGGTRLKVEKVGVMVEGDEMVEAEVGVEV